MNKTLQSHVCLVLFGVLTAASSLLIHQTERSIDPALVAFYAFSMSGIFYAVISRGSFFKKVLHKDFPWQDKKTVMILNATTALCWLSGLFSLKFISALAYLSVYLGGMPIIILFFKNIKSQCILLISAIILCITFFIKQEYTFFGLLLAMIGSISGVMYSLYANKMAEKLSSAEILSVRFLLLLGVSFVWALSKNDFHILPVSFYTHFLEIAFISVMLPLYFFQRGIAGLSPTIALRYMPLAPLICVGYGFLKI